MIFFFSSLIQTFVANLILKFIKLIRSIRIALLLKEKDNEEVRKCGVTTAITATVARYANAISTISNSTNPTSTFINTGNHTAFINTGTLIHLLIHISFYYVN